MRRLLTGPVVRGALGAIVGGLLLLGGIHAYSDHVALHIMLDFLNTHAAKIQRIP